MESIKSMTGFASRRVNLPAGSLSIDLKSVNSRYFEFSCKIQDDIKYLESALRDKLKAAALRGKFELILSFTPSASSSLNLNRPFLNELCARLKDIQEIYPQGQCDLMQILLYPGVISQDESTRAVLDSQILETFDAILADLLANREREGARLAQAIADKLNAIEQDLVPVKEMLSELTAQERAKLTERLKALPIEVDPNRLEQEVALLAQKADIAEEYDRLCSHISEVRRILKKGGACGKRLDFMMQEFNREANTMASKASNLSLTQVAVELKVLIEQMREQVQNIE